VENRPLAQWQTNHIRKMQEELGLPQAASNAEEVTMDEDLDEDMMGALPSDADAADADVGGLSVYSDPNVQKAMSAYEKLAAEQQTRYDAQAKALAEKRYGPSFSERMFQLSAALAAPTSRRGFGGVLENITPVLAAQQKAQREGQISRREALEQLETSKLAAQMGLAKQGLATSLAMAKIDAAAKKGTGPGQWSERFGRFIPKSGPSVPIKVGALGGRRIVTYTDGNSRLYGFGGNPKAYEILDAAGNVIGQETE
jgi:hypothetical protein